MVFGDTKHPLKISEIPKSLGIRAFLAFRLASLDLFFAGGRDDLKGVGLIGLHTFDVLRHDTKTRDKLMCEPKLNPLSFGWKKVLLGRIDLQK